MCSSVLCQLALDWYIDPCDMCSHNLQTKLRWTWCWRSLWSHSTWSSLALWRHWTSTPPAVMHSCNCSWGRPHEAASLFWSLNFTPLTGTKWASQGCTWNKVSLLDYHNSMQCKVVRDDVRIQRYPTAIFQHHSLSGFKVSSKSYRNGSTSSGKVSWPWWIRSMTEKLWNLCLAQWNCMIWTYMEPLDSMWWIGKLRSLTAGLPVW